MTEGELHDPGIADIPEHENGDEDEEEDDVEEEEEGGEWTESGDDDGVRQVEEQGGRDPGAHRNTMNLSAQNTGT